MPHMVDTALRLEDGSIFTGFTAPHGYLIEELAIRRGGNEEEWGFENPIWDLIEAGSIVEGFVDEAGLFYDRDETHALTGHDDNVGLNLI